MKTFRNKFLALLLITSVAFLSCKKEDRLSPSTNTSTANTRMSRGPILTQADWKITLFQENRVPETRLFNAYWFKFDKEGILKALTSGSSVTGFWSTGQKPNPEIFIIEFPSAPLNRLNKEWHIVNRTAVYLKLVSTNRFGQAEYLVFQRSQRQIEIGQLD